MSSPQKTGTAELQGRILAMHWDSQVPHIVPSLNKQLLWTHAPFPSYRINTETPPLPNSPSVSCFHRVIPLYWLPWWGEGPGETGSALLPLGADPEVLTVQSHIGFVSHSRKKDSWVLARAQKKNLFFCHGTQP